MTVTRRWQIGLIAFGIALIGVGGIVLLQDVAPKNYLGIIAWFAGAIILHDGIVAIAAFGVQLGLRRVGKRIPLAVLAIVQGAIVIGAIMALIVFPQIYKQGIGTNNPTVLPLDYAGNLVLFYVVLTVVTAIAVTGYLLVAPRRQKLRPSSVQN